MELDNCLTPTRQGRLADDLADKWEGQVSYVGIWNAIDRVCIPPSTL